VADSVVFDGVVIAAGESVQGVALSADARLVLEGAQ
jgi:hypothetical protein